MSADLVLPLAVDLLLKSSVVLGSAWAALRIWRRASASQRACVWCVAFALIALLPLTRLVAPRWTVSMFKANAPAEVATTMTTTGAEEGGGGQVIAASPDPGWEMPDGVTTGVLAWLFGVAALVGYRATGAFLLHRCRRASLPLRDPAAESLAEAIRSEFGIRRRIGLRVSRDCRMPVTWGTWRPVVLLPAEALAWPRPWLESALRHELAHVRNCDHFKRLAAFLISVAYWPNPLVWMAAKQLQLAQEEASDNLVLRGNASPQDYATQLVELIRNGAGRGVLALSGLAMARPSTLEGRLAALLDETRNRGHADRRLLLAGAGLAILAGSVLGAVQLRGAEQVQPVPAAKPGVATLRQKLKSIVFDKVDFNRTDIVDVVEFLQRKSKELDPEHEGINFVVRLTPLVVTQAVPAIHRELTLSLNKAALEDVLKAIAQQTNLQYSVEDFAVYLRPAIDDASVMSVRTYLVPAGLFQIATPAASVAGEATKVDVKTQLGNLGFRFPEGAAATFLPGSGKLVVRDTIDQLDALADLMAKSSAPGASSSNLSERAFYLSDKAARALQVEAGTQGDVTSALERRGIDFQAGTFAMLRPKHELDVKNAYPEMMKLQALLMAAAPEDWHGAPAAADGAAAPRAANDAADPTLAAKVKSIVLDKVNINQMDVAQVLQFLATKTRELDPEKKGINFVLGNVSPGDHVHRQVSVTLENLPLEDMLGYITTQTNLQWSIRNGAVVFATPVPQKAPGGAGSSQLNPQPVAGALWITSDGANSFQGNVATADVNATCHFQSCTLTADHLTYDRVTKKLTGTGHAKLVSPNGNTVVGYQIIVLDCDHPLGRYDVVSRPGA